MSNIVPPITVITNTLKVGMQHGAYKIEYAAGLKKLIEEVTANEARLVERGPELLQAAEIAIANNKGEFNFEDTEIILNAFKTIQAQRQHVEPGPKVDAPSEVAAGAPAAK